MTGEDSRDAGTTKYRVLVDDNFNYMDSDARWTAGEFDTADAAIAKCRQMVDANLASMHEPGMAADELFASYTGFGDDPFVIAPQGASPEFCFSSWDYAKQRCVEICGGTVPLDFLISVNHLCARILWVTKRIAKVLLRCLDHEAAHDRSYK